MRTTKQSSPVTKLGIASSLALLAMTARVSFHIEWRSVPRNTRNDKSEVVKGQRNDRCYTIETTIANKTIDGNHETW